MPASGRYTVQGVQVRAGVKLWARRSGARVVFQDDRSRPEEAARVHAQLTERGCRFVLGPYGSDSTRAVVEAVAGRDGAEAVVWNHGGAADDVQCLPGVVSLPSPASRYLTALGRAIVELRPSAAVALVCAPGRFARFAREALERAAPSLGVGMIGAFSFTDRPAELAEAQPQAILACGPIEREVKLFRAVAGLLPGAILGGVSPALAAFRDVLGDDPEGFLAPVQWHRELGSSPALGPSSPEVIAEAHDSDTGELLDYVAAQSYATALIADHCLALAPDDPIGAARPLSTTTFFGAFELDPTSGIQRGHKLSVIRWRRGLQELVLAHAE